jgi:adenylate cyclase
MRMILFTHSIKLYLPKLDDLVIKDGMFSALEILSALLVLVAIFALFFAVKWQIAQAKLSQIQHQQSLAAQRVIQPKQAFDAELQDLYAAKAQEARDLHHTIRRFIPKQFIQHLAAKNETDLKVGFADEDDLAILFVDICQFNHLAENLSPQQTLNFLNSFFLRMNAPIHGNNGFIDKFNGDAIMALFDHPDGNEHDKVMDSLQAAIGLRLALNLYNEHRENSGYQPINIGIGIHYGPVIIGTVGTEDRMDTTALGDSVNIAYRLEGLCRNYQADIIISEQIVLNLPRGHGMTFRILDNVIVKGRSQGQKIYEVLSHLSKQHQIIKLAQEKEILTCLSLRRQRRLDELADVASCCMSRYPTEPVFAQFLAQAEYLARNPQQENKSGAINSPLI